MNTKVIVKNQSNEVLQTVIFTDETVMNNWIQMLSISHPWGKPEHQIVDVPEQRIEHDVIPEVLYQAAKEAVLDENGNEITPAVEEVLAVDAVEAYTEIIPATYVTIPSEYSVEIIDVTAELEQLRVNREAEEYLKSTDWYILRSIDGEACSQEVKDLRAAARLAIVK